MEKLKKEIADIVATAKVEDWALEGEYNERKIDPLEPEGATAKLFKIFNREIRKAFKAGRTFDNLFDEEEHFRYYDFKDYKRKIYGKKKNKRKYEL